ncbi:hypothetical protein BKA62DRAFT_702624 [Auriculariales sp. MPI-PUGE-AT-0066]|nr:hypothetical protein BKA62DRAFT_702624 [Auriculariales sp. MPI-PUGE-AT-0066]
MSQLESSVFPAELYHHILSHLDKYGLVSVAQVNSTLLAFARPLLYRRVCFTEDSEYTDVVHFLNTIKSCDALCVLTLKLVVDWDPASDPDFIPLDSELGDCLRRMTNLVALSISPTVSATPAFDHAQGPLLALRQLHLFYNGNTEMAAFVVAHIPQLTHLTACATLRGIFGGLEETESRVVTSNLVHLRSTTYTVQVILAGSQTGFARLERLDLRTPHLHGLIHGTLLNVTFELVQQFCPNLKHLNFLENVCYDIPLDAISRCEYDSWHDSLVYARPHQGMKFVRIVEEHRQPDHLMPSLPWPEY